MNILNLIEIVLTIMRHILSCALALILSIVSFSSSSISFAQLRQIDPQSALELRPITVGSAHLVVEIAETHKDRQRGLMHRSSMPEERGMLFIFDEPQPLCFWMRNTLIPLSIAYLDAEHTIIDILDMQPLDESSICSTKPAQYALEVNQGWFERHQVSIGDQLNTITWEALETRQSLDN